mgnify:CR=1 FL=1|tara:strand:- start:14 stop:379 length:366 start_codon:yes stop_codon:yes gene_type:complete
MAYQVENINDALLTKKELKQKYKGREILFVCKVKDHNRFFGRSLKGLCFNLEYVYINWTPNKLAHIFRKYGNHYKDDNIEYLGFFLGDNIFNKYDSKKAEVQPKYWNELTSDYKLYPILSR